MKTLELKEMEVLEGGTLCELALGVAGIRHSFICWNRYGTNWMGLFSFGCRRLCDYSRSM